MTRTILFLMLLCIHNFNAQNSLIPLPKSIVNHSGSLTFTKKWTIVSSKSTKESTYLKDFLNDKFKMNVDIASQPVVGNLSIYLIENKKLKEDFYSLNINKSVTLEAKNGQGIFYAIQTLIQLINENEKIGSLPCLIIEDQVGDFSWRGMHLDCSRHFFSADFVKKYIDFIAMYKMNSFHWHLTDDQGWRIEIKKYPKLTSIGAWRNGSMVGAYSNQEFDGKKYGGFYTQKEIKEIVQYAKDRHINIIPEIEMPGHAVAAIAAYPELGCTGKQLEVEQKWGVFENVFCPKEETFTFLENVLTEVMELFPSKIIHIGGDECPKENWKRCSHCQDLIKKYNLKDEHGLQSYFIQRIEKFINSKGRKIIGWDEILEGGLAPNASVMSWRGFEGGIEAAKQHHPVVMTPGEFCYFDHYQGSPKNEPFAFGGHTTVEKVYAFNPVPKELTAQEKPFILGAQGNLWTEYILDSNHVEYMIFPRIAALSEVLWGNKSSYDDFRKRLFNHFSLLDRLNIHYSKAIYEVVGKSELPQNNNPVTYSLRGFDGTKSIFYTLDGSTPTTKSIPYSAPFSIDKSASILAIYFENGEPKSKVFSQNISVSKSTGKKVNLEFQPKEKYAGMGAQTLTDGIIGDPAKYGTDWLGFSGDNFVATIDLGQKTSFSNLKTNFITSNENWIHFPQNMTIWISNDGKNFTQIKEVSNDFIKQYMGKLSIDFLPQQARYVKVMAQNTTKIPQGFAGASYPAWLFVDEIQLD